MSPVEPSPHTFEDPWGPHRSSIEERLSSCADFLGRLQRSLDGGAAPDRHYFSMRAHDLYESARDLVRLTEAVEHWLIACDATVIHPDPDRSVEGYCELPRNHDGGHDDSPRPTLPTQTRDSARDLMDLAEETARRVNGLGLEADQRRAFGVVRGFDPDADAEYDDVHRLGASLIYTASKASGLIHDFVDEQRRRERDAVIRYVDLDGDDIGEFIEDGRAPRSSGLGL